MATVNDPNMYLYFSPYKRHHQPTDSIISKVIKDLYMPCSAVALTYRLQFRLSTLNIFMSQNMIQPATSFVLA